MIHIDYDFKLYIIHIPTDNSSRENFFVLHVRARVCMRVKGASLDFPASMKQDDYEPLSSASPM